MSFAAGFGAGRFAFAGGRAGFFFRLVEMDLADLADLAATGFGFRLAGLEEGLADLCFAALDFGFVAMIWGGG